MKTSNGVADSPKVGEPQKKVLKLDDVKGLLKRDVHACMLMLQAIYDDQDVMDVLATSLHGKYLNKLHKDELEKQGNLPL